MKEEDPKKEAQKMGQLAAKAGMKAMQERKTPVAQKDKTSVATNIPKLDPMTKDDVDYQVALNEWKTLTPEERRRRQEDLYQEGDNWQKKRATTRSGKTQFSDIRDAFVKERKLSDRNDAQQNADQEYDSYVRRRKLQDRINSERIYK